MVGGTTTCTWNFGPHWPSSFENADFQSISAYNASAVTPSEAVQLSLRVWTSTARQLCNPRRRQYSGPGLDSGWRRRRQQQPGVSAVCLVGQLLRSPSDHMLPRHPAYTTSNVTYSYRFGNSTPLQKWLAEIWAKLTVAFKKADFQSIFACSTSAVTPSQKDQLTLIGSPLSAFQWA